MAATVNTVTGPISSEDLGKTLVHEHFMFGYPGYQGDATLGPFDREEAVRVGVAAAERAKSHGVKTIIDATPNECGRNVEVLREISERAEIQIVCSTGYYYEGEGAPAYFNFRRALGTAEEEIYEMFSREITEGIAGTGIRAGVIKLASSKDAITDYEAMFFSCGARVQKETGTPIITHTQEGTMGPEQAELLVSEGADPRRCQIGHMDGNTDVVYHMNTLAHEVNVAFDRFGIQGIVGAPMDEARTACLIGLLGMGYTERILLSHDTVNLWLGRPLRMPEQLQRLLANWHIGHLFENIIPKLRQAGVTEEQIETIFVENPKRLFDPLPVREAAGATPS
ncbi:Phosphotriesterase homology protein [Rubrobacter xylanophilus DSM 9941]|uniref:phosphotriesterase family protein n=1 Tax=Rubrobacter xylanophilus TaxID=49319 RepID=UPI001C63BBE4|nr:phosphotriesterase-related protein [Rubrobacter xylanophilus]QYJ17272.1 Phosphotriesterase homology protein [Rubrobacter xylanophilus DSM 9941]